jgi:hypothetical protein
MAARQDTSIFFSQYCLGVQTMFSVRPTQAAVMELAKLWHVALKTMRSVNFNPTQPFISPVVQNFTSAKV